MKDDDKLKQVRKEITILQANGKVPVATQLWRHLKTGTVYVSAGYCIQEYDLAILALYREHGETGPYWVCPLAEFMDGRFVLMTQEDRKNIRKENFGE